MKLKCYSKIEEIPTAFTSEKAQDQGRSKLGKDGRNEEKLREEFVIDTLTKSRIMRINGTTIFTKQAPTELDPVAIYEGVGYDANGRVVWRGVSKTLYKSVDDYRNAKKAIDLYDSIHFVHRTDLPEFDWERKPIETRFVSSKNLE